MGLNGAFFTGDLFNLLVFFEVLLVASIACSCTGAARRACARFHYVVVNLADVRAVLIGIALLYAVTGTLNFADLAVRVPRVARPPRGLVTSLRSCCSSS